MPQSTKTEPVMTQGFVTLLLGLLLGVQPVATDVYLSALPSIAKDLSASVLQTQLTLSAMLLAFGFAQLLLGPVSDRFGRRPTMLWGTGMFTLAAMGTVLAGSIESLILLRALQGAAMGAVVMSGRAIARDLYEPERSAMVVSKAFTGLGVIALCSALIGSWISELVGWRATLAVVALFGAALWALLYARYQETNRKLDPTAMQWRQMLHNIQTIASHRGFVCYSLVSICSYAALFTFLISSPFVLIQVLGLSKLQYGLCLFVMPVFYIAGTFYCRRLLHRFGLQRAVQRAAWMSLTAGLAISVLAMWGYVQLWAILLPFYLFIYAHGVMQSSSQSGAVAHFPNMAGTAAALLGFLMMLVAFVYGFWLGAHAGDAHYAMTRGMGVWCTLLAATAWFLVPRFGKV